MKIWFGETALDMRKPAFWRRGLAMTDEFVGRERTESIAYFPPALQSFTRRLRAEWRLTVTKRPTQTPTPGQTQPTRPPLTAQGVLACLDLLSRRRAAQVSRMSSMTRLKGVSF